MADIGSAKEATGSTWGATPQRVPKQEYDKDLFIKLLVAQMQYQDPLQPQDNGQMISQMATFSQLEQMQAMSNSMNATAYFGMIGKGILYQDGANSDGEPIMASGVVSSVEQNGGKFFMVVNGKLIPMEAVMAVVDANEATGGNVTASAHLVGKNVTGAYSQIKKDENGNDVKDEAGNLINEVVKVSGKVTKVAAKDGGVYASIVDAEGNTHEVHVNDITEISE